MSARGSLSPADLRHARALASEGKRVVSRLGVATAVRMLDDRAEHHLDAGPVDAPGASRNDSPA